ncbi:MAG: DUF2911 domain-containing protein [Gillisia sp.]
MKLFFKILVILILVAVAGLFIFRYATKAHSPEATVDFNQKGLKMEVFYNRPYKKNRQIFGNLVPFQQVWRTGANEATTFETNKDILVDGSLLKAGKYTLWTIPGRESWKIIFNSKMYPWGIKMNGDAYRDPGKDALMLEIPVRPTANTVEQFTIYFDTGNDFIYLNLAWDDTLIEIPIKQKNSPD